MLTAPLVFAALSAGLLGGVHCIGMCGGIANMLTSAGRKQPAIIPIIPVQSPASRRGARLPCCMPAEYSPTP